MKIIVFEGLDGSGKSTLKKEVDKITNYKYVCMDRFTGSTLIYDEYTQRQNRKSEIYKLEKELSDNIFMIYCYCSTSTTKKRLKEKKDELTIKNAIIQAPIFEEYLKQTPYKFVRINTDKPINTCVKKVVEAIKK